MIVSSPVVPKFHWSNCERPLLNVPFQYEHGLWKIDGLLGSSEAYRVHDLIDPDVDGLIDFPELRFNRPVRIRPENQMTEEPTLVILGG